MTSRDTISHQHPSCWGTAVFWHSCAWWLGVIANPQLKHSREPKGDVPGFRGYGFITWVLYLARAAHASLALAGHMLDDLRLSLGAASVLHTVLW